MKVINIDPYETDTAKYLRAETIKIVPNTDVALMLGIAYYLYTNNLHDKKFLEKYTVGFNQFKDYLIGKKDGVKKTPSWASKKTGISKTKIEELAKLMISGTTMFMTGWSMQRAHHGEQPNWMVFTLASMLGQIGKDGGGFGSSNMYSSNGSDVQNGVGVSSITTKGAGVVSSEGNAAEDSIPVARISDMLLNPGKTIDYNGKKITYRNIKMIWWAGGNPMHHHQDRNTMIKAWQKPEVIVNQDPFWTATSRMADIVLPATTEIERDDITNIGSSSKYGIAAIKKGIEPVAESKNDYDIFKDLCAMYGKEEEFTEGRTQKEWVKHFYEKSLMQAKVKKIDMPTFDEFWEKGIVYFDKVVSDSETYNAFEEFIADPLENPLGTPSGKIEIFSKKIDSFKYDDCKGHPTWFEPAEYLGNSTKEYSFHLISPHPKFRLHSQLDNTIMREVYSVNGREPVVINPKNAKEKGIKDGDVVMLSSPRGKVLAGAVVSADVRENVLYMQEGGWYDPLEPGEAGTLCVHGDVNVVTLDISTSKLAQATSAHTTLVNIEKFIGKVPPVKVFSKPNLG